MQFQHVSLAPSSSTRSVFGEQQTASKQHRLEMKGRPDRVAPPGAWPMAWPAGATQVRSEHWFPVHVTTGCHAAACVVGPGGPRAPCSRKLVPAPGPSNHFSVRCQSQGGGESHHDSAPSDLVELHRVRRAQEALVPRGILVFGSCSSPGPAAWRGRDTRGEVLPSRRVGGGAGGVCQGAYVRNPTGSQV